MALFNKPKKMIKGTLATAKIPMSKESASAPEEMTREHLLKAIDFKLLNESGELAGPPEDTNPYWDKKRTEREKIITEAPEVSPVPAPVAQAATTPVVKAPTVAPVKEAPLSSMLTHEVYTKLTGKPWSTAKKEGLTDGSAASNLKLKAMLLDKANKVPASKSTVDKPANVKLESKDIADLRKKMTTPLAKKAVTPTPATPTATPTPAATPKSTAQPKVEAKPAKSLRDLTKKTTVAISKNDKDVPSNTTRDNFRSTPSIFDKIVSSTKGYFDKEDPSRNARRKMSTAEEIKYLNAKRQSKTVAPKKSQAESNTIPKDWRKWDGTGDAPVQPSHNASNKEWEDYGNSPQSRRYNDSYDRENRNTRDESVFVRRNLKEADFLNTKEQRGRFANERELRKKQMEDEEIKRNKDVPSNTIRDTFRTPSSSKFNKVTVKKKDSGPVNAKDVAKYIRRPGLF